MEEEKQELKSVNETLVKVSKIDENELTEQRQIIFEGPPGTSKTYFAMKFAKYFTENNIEDVTNLIGQVEEHSN